VSVGQRDEDLINLARSLGVLFMRAGTLGTDFYTALSLIRMYVANPASVPEGVDLSVLAVYSQDVTIVDTALQHGDARFTLVNVFELQRAVVRLRQWLESSLRLRVVQLAAFSKYLRRLPFLSPDGLTSYGSAVTLASTINAAQSIVIAAERPSTAVAQPIVALKEMTAAFEGMWALPGMPVAFEDVASMVSELAQLGDAFVIYTDLTPDVVRRLAIAEASSIYLAADSEMGDAFEGRSAPPQYYFGIRSKPYNTLFGPKSMARTLEQEFVTQDPNLVLAWGVERVPTDAVAIRASTWPINDPTAFTRVDEGVLFPLPSDFSLTAVTATGKEVKVKVGMADISRAFALDTSHLLMTMPICATSICEASLRALAMTVAWAASWASGDRTADAGDIESPTSSVGSVMASAAAMFGADTMGTWIGTNTTEVSAQFVSNLQRRVGAGAAYMLVRTWDGMPAMDAVIDRVVRELAAQGVISRANALIDTNLLDQLRAQVVLYSLVVKYGLNVKLAGVLADLLRVYYGEIMLLRGSSRSLPSAAAASSTIAH